MFVFRPNLLGGLENRPRVSCLLPQGRHAEPGTVHLLTINTTSHVLAIERVRLNGYEMADMPNDLAIWWQAVPHIVQAGELMDIMIKLRRPTKKLVRITAVLSSAEEVCAVLDPAPPPLKFTFIGYSKDRSTVYPYLENTGGESLHIKKLFRDAENVTDRCYIPESSMGPSTKALAIFTPHSPLQSGRWGQFVEVIAVMTV